MNKKLKLIIKTVLEKYFNINLLSVQLRTKIANGIINIYYDTYINVFNTFNTNEKLLPKLVAKEIL